MGHFTKDFLVNNALAYQSEKMDVQIDLLNLMATAVSGIDRKMIELHDLINRAQTYAATAKIDCTCVPVVNKLVTIPEAMTGLIQELKANLTRNVITPWNNKVHCQSRQLNPRTANFSDSKEMEEIKEGKKTGPLNKAGKNLKLQPWVKLPRKMEKP